MWTYVFGVCRQSLQELVRRGTMYTQIYERERERERRVCIVAQKCITHTHTHKDTDTQPTGVYYKTLHLLSGRQREYRAAASGYTQGELARLAHATDRSGNLAAAATHYESFAREIPQYQYMCAQ